MLGHMTKEQMEEMLASELTGRIGCHAEGQTYVVPVTYAYQEGFIVGHTGEGLKVELMRKNPEVCFEVDRMESLAQWKSVIVRGHFEELQREEASKAMMALTERLRPFVTQDPAALRRLFPEMERAVEGGRRGIAYRIRVDSMTGRFEQD